MSYLRPVNSSEGNLYSIRFTTPALKSVFVDNFDTLASNYYPFKTDNYDNPSSDLLPSSFQYSVGNGTSNSYKINYGTMTNPFVYAPTVNIAIYNDGSANGSPMSASEQYAIRITAISTSEVIWEVRDKAGAIVQPSDGTIGNTLNIRFNIMITGAATCGATFTMSNRGWNVPENNATKVYTYKSVAVGTGKVDATFNVKGTIATTPYVETVTDANQSTILNDGFLKHHTCIIKSTDASITSNAVFTLPTTGLADGQTLRIIGVSTITDGDSVELDAGSIGNASTNLVISNSANLNTTTELIFSTTDATWYHAA